MKVKSIHILLPFLIFVFSGFVLYHTAQSAAVREDDRTYLVDRTGERWDITQAVSIGFDPHHFEFGIGRHAFRPLTEQDWHAGDIDGRRNFRVIGVSDGHQSQAYAVSKLARHETANTILANQPIVVGY